MYILYVGFLFVALLPFALFFGWLQDTSFEDWLEKKYPKLHYMFFILQMCIGTPFLISSLILSIYICIGVPSYILFCLLRHCFSDPPIFEPLPAELIKERKDREHRDWQSDCNDRFAKVTNVYNARYKERLEEWLGYCYPQILDDRGSYEGLMTFDQIKLKTGIQDLSYAAANEIVKENRESAFKNISAGITTTEEEKECAASFLQIENTNRPINLCIYGVYSSEFLRKDTSYDGGSVGVVESLHE